MKRLVAVMCLLLCVGMISGCKTLKGCGGATPCSVDTGVCEDCANKGSGA